MNQQDIEARMEQARSLRKNVKWLDPKPTELFVVDVLDLLALALTAHNHNWTYEERTGYERAIHELTGIYTRKQRRIANGQKESGVLCDACGKPIKKDKDDVGYECHLHEGCIEREDIK